MRCYIKTVFKNRTESDYADEDDDIFGQEPPFVQDDFDQNAQSKQQYEQYTDTLNNNAANALFSDKHMIRLYRQLAKKLHPERELDPDKKAEKMDWMK